MTDEQRLERERGNIRDGYASLHSAQLGAQFLLAQLDTARQQLAESQAQVIEEQAFFADEQKQLTAARQQRDALEQWPTLAAKLRNELAAAEQREAQLREALTRLRKYLLDQPWHERCEIILDYMPPYPHKDTRPTVQVRYNDGSEHPPMLRYSRGPKQGFFWDIYGEDFQDEQLAIIGLSQTPAPRSVGPICIQIPLATKEQNG